ATLYAYVSRGMLAPRGGGRRGGGGGPCGGGGRPARDGARAPRSRAVADAAQPGRAAGTGDFVMESQLPDVADGGIRYRGMEVTKLAMWRPFEEVAGWLWTGGLGKNGSTETREGP